MELEHETTDVEQLGTSFERKLTLKYKIGFNMSIKGIG